MVEYRECQVVVITNLTVLWGGDNLHGLYSPPGAGESPMWVG